MRTLGIDLSADEAKTAVCEIDWVQVSVRLLGRDLSDELLVEAVAGADRSGIDVPLGWPDAFVEAVTAHHHERRWPPAADHPRQGRIPLRYRLTDLVATSGGARPLSVSTDRIGVAAMRGARIQHLLAQVGVEVDRSGLAGAVVEAYPAGALVAWGLPSRGYKQAEGSRARAALVTDVVRRCGPLARPASAALAGGDDDDLDAFLCALVARAAALGRTQAPAAGQLDQARREGWIHLPAVPIEELCARDGPGRA